MSTLFIILTVLFFGAVSSQSSGNCVCVPYYLCRSNGTVITDGEGLFDARLGNSCENTCTCTGIEVCCNLVKEEVTELRALQNKTKSCGFRNPNGVGFKGGIGDTEALFGEWPWMVQIYEDGAYRCGGSLIHPSVVLTAAHCVREPKSIYTVRVGEWDTSSTNELLKHQDSGVASVKLHENFNKKNFRNDVALLFLNETLELRPHVNIACLASSSVPDGSRCFATGWGKAQWGANQNHSTILKKIDLPIVGKPECQNLLRKTRLGPYYNLHEAFMCAGGEKDKDTCTGDGGGPLVCLIDGTDEKYQQVGIVSYGLDCNQENEPGVYADVSVLRSWIDKEMKAKNLDTELYKY